MEALAGPRPNHCNDRYLADSVEKRLEDSGPLAMLG